MLILPTKNNGKALVFNILETFCDFDKAGTQHHNQAKTL